MKSNTLFLALLFLFLHVGVQSQTGPAGVGTNTSSTNQVRFWVKSDVGVYNNAGTTLAAHNNSVQQWNDQSGLTNHAVQTTASRQPVYRTNQVNGLPALKFFGSTYITASGTLGIANNVGYTYFIVFKDTTYTAGAMGDGNGDYIIDRGLPGPEGNELASFKISSTNKYGFQKRDATGGGLGGPVSTSTVNNGSYRVVSYLETPGATKVYDLYLDGTLEGTLSAADGDYVPPIPQIGHHYQPANGGLKGYFAEMIIYNYNLNTTQINIVNNYLASKYGLSLTANDKYVGDTPGNGDYDFEVAGVGKESSGSNLSASSAITGGLEATQSTLMGNGEYLLYGHPTGTNSLNYTDVGGMSTGTLNARWDRIWYLDWTHVGGSTESVNLTFDCSDAGMGSVTTATPLSNYKLLHRTATSGTWTEVMSSSSISGDRVTFNSVPYTTGDGYYTIGTLNATLSPLPIELFSFKAMCKDEGIQLNWATASERNNDFFTVERSIDGLAFDDAGRVKGAGTTSRFNYYSFLDEYPFKGIYYYRLKQTDFDQSYNYSQLIDVSCYEDYEGKLTVSPNPADKRITLNISGSERPCSVEIMNSKGEVVFNDHFTSELVVDTEGFASGIYVIRLKSPDTLNGEHSQTKRFVKN